MKKLLSAIAIIGMFATIASADWLVNFNDTYKAKGIDDAVKFAVEEGAAPDAIMENSLILENLNPQNIVKALYCAGVTGEDIYNAAQKYNISQDIVDSGFKKSVEECADTVAETQPYTPVTTGGTNFSGPSRGSSSGVTLSESSF